MTQTSAEVIYLSTEVINLSTAIVVYCKSAWFTNPSCLRYTQNCLDGHEPNLLSSFQMCQVVARPEEQFLNVRHILEKDAYYHSAACHCTMYLHRFTWCNCAVLRQLGSGLPASVFSLWVRDPFRSHDFPAYLSWKFLTSRKLMAGTLNLVYLRCSGCRNVRADWACLVMEWYIQWRI